MIKIGRPAANKITDMPALLKYIAGIFRSLAYLLIGTAFLMTVGLITLYSIRESRTVNELINSTNKVLQSSLAGQTEVLINNPDFISYIRSGTATRQNNFEDFQFLLFTYLDNKLISAINIVPIGSKQPIFKTGTPTKLYLTFELCYLNDRFNSKLGSCTNLMTLFFNESEYIKRLNKLDNKISNCTVGEQCISFPPFQSSNRLQIFGNRFIVQEFSTYPLKLKFFVERPYIWLGIFIIFFTLLCFIAFIENHLLRNIINKVLINPLQEITEKFKNNVAITANKEETYISELKSLVNVVLDGRQKAIEAEFVHIAKKITHDINSKVATLNAIISSKEIKKDQIIMAKRACIEIEERISTLLSVTKPGGKTSGTHVTESNMSSWCLVDLLIQDLISQKQIEWANNDIICYIAFENIGQQHIWVNINTTLVKDVLSNLLNNSYEATLIKLQNLQYKLNNIDLSNFSINIKVINNSNELLINIQDFGCGIPDGKIELVKSGTSLKPNGNGIGLSSAIKFFESIGGALMISSTAGIGTLVSIKIPLNRSYPKWMANKIKVEPNEFIVVVEDDELIQQEWMNKFAYLRLKSKHFLQSADFETWFIENFDNIGNPTIIMDYELDSETNGLQLLEGKKLRNVYLITSHAEEYWLQQIINKTSYYLIPKLLLNEIDIVDY